MSAPKTNPGTGGNVGFVLGADEARLLRDRWSLLLAVQPQLSKKNEHSIACSSFPFSLLFLMSCVLTSRVLAALSRTLFRSHAPLTFTVIGVNVGRRTRCIPICFCSHGYTPQKAWRKSLRPHKSHIQKDHLLKGQLKRSKERGVRTQQPPLRPRRRLPGTRPSHHILDCGVQGP